MKIEEAIHLINLKRQKLNLKPIEMRTRPSVSSPGKITIEIRADGELLHKSTHWGAISPFLKGMLSAFNEKAIPNIESPAGRTKRLIQF